MPSTDALIQAGIDSGVLDESFHSSILRRLDFFCEQTRVPASYICSSAKTLLTPDEMKHLRRFPKYQDKGFGGFIFTGEAQRSMTEVFCTIGGWLIRNKYDARIYTVQELATDARLEGPGLPDCRVLLVPDFYITGRTISDWVRNTVDTMIYSRFAAGQFTILYCEKVGLMKSQYGLALAMHIAKTYKDLTP
jgi:hypothetical protein